MKSTARKPIIPIYSVRKEASPWLMGRGRKGPPQGGVDADTGGKEGDFPQAGCIYRGTLLFLTVPYGLV